MKFERVAIESLGFTLPPEVISSAEIEQRLAPLYERLNLPEGRLELMSGIRERRLWPRGATIAGPSVHSARLALEAADFAPSDVGCLIHASVCRDYLEPATACRVHAELGLGPECWVQDVSNACLGLLNGMVHIATLIESGCIRAGIVVGTENARSLLESTIASLNSDSRITRQTLKPSFASLTIGSGSCAILLVNAELSGTGNRLQACTSRAECGHHGLCQSDTDQAGAAMQPLMQTDSEQLLQAGVAVAGRTFEQLLHQGFSREQFDATVCHQVGAVHRKALLEALDLPSQRDFSTFSWLGNTGSVALPTALALGLKSAIEPSSQVALLGIGSGINSIMMSTTWETPLVAGELDSHANHNLRRVSKISSATSR